MLIQIGYNITVRVFDSATIVFLLRVHPSGKSTLLTPDRPRIQPKIPVEYYRDPFGNYCGRLSARTATVSLRHRAIVWDSGKTDARAPLAEAVDVEKLPPETLPFLLPSRYCEADSELMTFSWARFGKFASGWAKVEAICDFVHNHLRFDYQQARSNRTALDTFQERVGVCRDFTHLGITLCRCLNIPARYVTGYLGDIGVAPMPDPMDFSAWFEVYLGGRWYSLDARHNQPRIGRIVIGRGRDAADVPIIMTFGRHCLNRFEVITEELDVKSQPDRHIYPDAIVDSALESITR
jgi:transglutaminase-like putative cysteine protease